MFLLEMMTCGTTGIQFDPMVPKLVSTLVTLIKIGVPIILIVYGMMDLGKAVMAQKEDEIKKGQQTFMKRLMAAVIVFLVFFVVQTVVSLVANDKDNISSCLDCFISNKCSTYK